MWRVQQNLRLEPVEELPDGSFLARVFDSKTDRRRRHPVIVRVIDYCIEDGCENEDRYRLITTLLDHQVAPAAALAAVTATAGSSSPPSTS